MTWSVHINRSSSSCSTSRFQFCDVAKIGWVAIENPLILRRISSYFTATQQLSVGSQIRKQEAKEWLELHNLRTHHVTTHWEFKYLIEPKVVGTATLETGSRSKHGKWQWVHFRTVSQPGTSHQVLVSRRFMTWSGDCGSLPTCIIAGSPGAFCNTTPNCEHQLRANCFCGGFLSYTAITWVALFLTWVLNGLSIQYVPVYNFANMYAMSYRSDFCLKWMFQYHYHLLKMSVHGQSTVLVSGLEQFMGCANVSTYTRSISHSYGLKCKWHRYYCLLKLSVNWVSTVYVKTRKAPHHSTELSRPWIKFLMVSEVSISLYTMLRIWMLCFTGLTIFWNDSFNIATTSENWPTAQCLWFGLLRLRHFAGGAPV